MAGSEQASLVGTDAQSDSDAIVLDGAQRTLKPDQACLAAMDMMNTVIPRPPASRRGRDQRGPDPVTRCSEGREPFIRRI